MNQMKKIIATILTLALVLGLCSATAFAADDIVLDGDNGESAFIGEYSATANNGYKYLGFATTKEATSDYKYLQFTYTGDIKYLRLEFETEGGDLAGPYWMTTDQMNHLKTVDGSAIPTTGNNTTVVIDLSASGISVGDYWGFHIHYLDPSFTTGSFTISDARFMTAATSSPAGDAPAGDAPAGDAPAETQASTQAPATGSTAVPTVIACLVVLCAGAVLVFNKKRA